MSNDPSTADESADEESPLDGLAMGHRVPSLMLETRERITRVEETQETILDQVERVDANIEEVAETIERIDAKSLDQKQFRQDVLPKVRSAHRMAIIMKWGGPVALALTAAVIAAGGAL
jgi:hypothetical protein